MQLAHLEYDQYLFKWAVYKLITDRTKTFYLTVEHSGCIKYP